MLLLLLLSVNTKWTHAAQHHVRDYVCNESALFCFWWSIPLRITILWKKKTKTSKSPLLSSPPLSSPLLSLTPSISLTWTQPLLYSHSDSTSPPSRRAGRCEAMKAKKKKNDNNNDAAGGHTPVYLHLTRARTRRLFLYYCCPLIILLMLTFAYLAISTVNNRLH